MNPIKAISQSIRIQGRKMDFNFDLSTLPKYWYDNDAFKSTFMNALSCQFPEGEKMFMDSVRAYKHKIKDPVLLEQIAGFIKQEAFHGHEHKLFNDYLEHHGYPAKDVEDFQRKERLWLKERIHPKHLLAATCALEHFTAIMANYMLTNPELRNNVHPKEFAELWLWHAIEETEHKAVAFDVYQEAIGSYWLRVLTMVNITIMFCLRTSMIQARFLWKDGKLFHPRTWWQGFRFYFLEPGLVRNIAKDYLDYFRRDFHPWQHDNRELLQEWDKEHNNYRYV